MGAAPLGSGVSLGTVHWAAPGTSQGVEAVLVPPAWGQREPPSWSQGPWPPMTLCSPGLGVVRLLPLPEPESRSLVKMLLLP